MYPLRMWTSTVNTLTGLKKEEDIKLAYKDLVEHLNSIYYGRMLDTDPDLFIVDQKSDDSKEKYVP